MRTDRRRLARAFFYIKMTQWRRGPNLPVETQAVYHRHPELTSAEVLNCDPMLDGAESGAGSPLPVESQMRLLRLIDKDHSIRFNFAGASHQMPGERKPFPSPFHKCGQ